MPGRILHSHRMRWAAGIFAGYWAMTPFVDPVELAQVLMLVLVFVACGVVIKYFGQVYHSILVDDRSAISQLAQGIILAFVGLIIGLVWTAIGRILPGADWMLRSPVMGFYLLCYVVAGSLHMTARRNSDGRVSHGDIRDVMVAYALGLGVSIVLMALQLGGFLRKL